MSLAMGARLPEIYLASSQRIGRVYRLHANKREDLDLAAAGDIVGVMGIDCVSGDTACSP